jgi:pyocin large subunit-like protein
VPFATSYDRTAHFQKHRSCFGARSEFEYEAMADAFLLGPLDRHTTAECYRSGGAVLRYNAFTEEFGVVGPHGFVLTYFKPDPVVHGLASNYAYFLAECQK